MVSGSIIRLKRKSKRGSIKWLSSVTGISVKKISMLENNRCDSKKITLYEIKKISTTLNIPSEILIKDIMS